VVHDEWTTLLRINAESKRHNADADADVVKIQSTVVGWFQKTPAPIVSWFQKTPAPIVSWFQKTPAPIVGWDQKTPAPILDRDLQDYETKPITVKELPLLTIESIIFSFVLINAILRYIE
jgi:hypothetical protein